MRTIRKGDVVLVPFPFTDLSQTKLRPAIVLWVDQTASDVTLCFITSQNLAILRSDEFLIDLTDPEFIPTGLKIASKVRVSRMLTLESRLIYRYLGKLGINQIQQLNTILIQVFVL